MPDLYTAQPNGTLTLNLHWGQWQAWQAAARWVLVLAGTQSGKTSFGPLWLWREIARQGAGDYIVGTPTFPLLELKALPEFRHLFEDVLALGRYISSPVRKFVFSMFGSRRTFGSTDPATVYFGHAQDPESLESMTAAGAWLDEAGQRKFRVGSWQAVQRRLSLRQGRALLTTTPYYLGWLKADVYDRWRAGDKDYAVVNFASTMNPAFSAEEFARARESLPGWQFRMFYEGKFERPAGLIYDCFTEQQRCPRFAVPADWPRFLGLDFGGVNTAGIFFALDPRGPRETARLYAYREYRAGGRTASEHAAALLAGEPSVPDCVGGSKSEGQWRDEFRAAGLPVRAPGISDVEVGIGRVYGALKRGEVVVMDDLAGTLDQFGAYSRALDASGQPTAAIEDKETYHYLDAVRYIVGWVKGSASPGVFF